MTADDVAYSLNRTIQSTYTQKFTGVMESAEVVDDSTVKVRLKHPYGPILYCFTNPSVAIVSKKAVEEAGDTFGRNPVELEFLQFVEVSGEKVVLTRFGRLLKGPAYKEVTFRFITDATTAAIMLEKGEIDILHNLPETEKLK